MVHSYLGVTIKPKPSDTPAVGTATELLEMLAMFPGAAQL